MTVGLAELTGWYLRLRSARLYGHRDRSTPSHGQEVTDEAKG
jgi:hypothetical protein